MLSVLYLKEKGFDVRAMGIDEKGISDEDVMRLASSEQRTILTFDSDYGELIFKYGFHPEKGVIYLRLTEYSAEEPGVLIEDLINRKSVQFDFALTVLDPNGVRQRRYGQHSDL